MPRPTHNETSYLPGLDGIRALAVTFVLLYHLGVPGFGGGLLGVGVFFTLSGFLITSLLISTRQRTGGLGLRTFWIRRARRLMPAVILVLAATLVTTAIVLPDKLTTYSWQALTALFYVNNWYNVGSSTSYFDRFAAPSPLSHMWSLSIEEQFYIFWPLILAALFIAVKRRMFITLITLAMALGSFYLLATLAAPGFDNTRVYEGTDTRAGGLLLGAALAFWWPARKHHVEGGRRWIVEVLGLAGLAVVVYLVCTTGDNSLGLYHWGLLVLTFATMAVLAAAVTPATLVARFLSLPPLRWIGERSYGIYLWHMPVVAFLPMAVRSESLIFGALLCTAVTLILATLSWRYIEDPIRHYGLIGALTGRRDDDDDAPPAPAPATPSPVLTAAPATAWESTIPLGPGTLVEEPVDLSAGEQDASVRPWHSARPLGRGRLIEESLVLFDDEHDTDDSTAEESPADEETLAEVTADEESVEEAAAPVGVPATLAMVVMAAQSQADQIHDDQNDDEPVPASVTETENGETVTKQFAVPGATAADSADEPGSENTTGVDEPATERLLAVGKPDDDEPITEQLVAIPGPVPGTASTEAAPSRENLIIKIPGPAPRPAPAPTRRGGMLQPVIVTLVVLAVAVAALVGTAKIDPDMKVVRALSTATADEAPLEDPDAGKPTTQPVGPTLPEDLRRTKCQTVIHVGDSTSIGMNSPDMQPNPALRLVGQYKRVGATTFHDDVVGGRSSLERVDDQPNAVESIQADLARGWRGCWVMAMGINDTANVQVGGQGPLDWRIDRLLKPLGDQPVLWPTVVTNDLNQNPAYDNRAMQRFNRALLRACKRYPNLRIYDWASDVDQDWFADGVHYTEAGYIQRARDFATALATVYPKDDAVPQGCLLKSVSVIEPPLKQQEKQGK
ncbi:MAG: acyltransferase family protein [Gordonia sp. (in: high G+C Gram-positive bacteria)]